MQIQRVQAIYECRFCTAKMFSSLAFLSQSISERSILCFRVAALFLCPPAKFSSSLHSPTVFCEFTSKMVGGFLLLQARSCFLKFFQICRVFVAFSGPFSAYRNRKAHDLHRIFNGQSWVYLWCARGNSNPWPSD